jgi:hypothetical protein
MGSVRQNLLDLIESPGAYDQPAAETERLQIEGAREVFAEKVEQIPVLKRRAEECGVKEISSLHDLVPLLFSHTVYKSYPPSFVEKKQWQRLAQWLDTVSTHKSARVDMEGVDNVDDWIERLRVHGHHILATSGSSGKCSFLDHSKEDYHRKLRHWRNTLGWPLTRPNQDRIFFALGPSRGPNSAIEAMLLGAELWAKPGNSHFLTDEPLRISDVSVMAATRKRMAEGTCSPSEIAAFEADSAGRGKKMAEALREFADKILAHRHQPIVLSGLWAQHLQIIARARELGIGDGEFQPNSVISAGGGIKGVALPDDYKEQVTRFYGPVLRPGAYGMTELFQMMPRCEAQRYHRPPGLIWMLLDQAGEKLVHPEPGTGGQVEGRFAFLDLSLDGRWGGLITGDKVTVDFADRCPCGRSGPTILDTITRYAQPGQDDHIGCAGTIDGYIRGMLAP